MAWIEGLLGGFLTRKNEVEAQNRAAAEASAGREMAVYQALLSSPNAEIKALAAAGLLESTQPRKKKGGLSGWMGEMETSPTFAQMRQLIQTPVDVPAVPGRDGVLPSRGFEPSAPPAAPQAALLQAPGAAPMGTPSASLTQVGAPPPPALGAIQGAPGGRGTGATAPMSGTLTPPPSLDLQRGAAKPGRAAVPAVPAHQEPRQVFASPESLAVQQARGRAQGNVEGEVAGLVAAGFGEEEARALIKEKYERQARMGRPLGWREGEIVEDPNSDTGWSQILYNPLNPTQQMTIPASAPLDRSTRSVTPLESLAHSLFGQEGEDPRATMRRLDPTQQAALTAEARERTIALPGEQRARVGDVEANVPLTTQQRFQATSDLVAQWTSASANFLEMQRQYGLMQAGLDRYDADPIGGSQAVLVTFQKVLDPTSVVRESEYARSAQGLSARDWLQGMYDKYKSGGVGVPKDVLTQMVKTAEVFLTDENMASARRNVQQRIHDTAVSYKIEPREVFGADVLPSTAGTGAPTRGAARPTAPGGAAPAAGPAGFTVRGGVLYGPDGKPVE